VSPDNTAPHSPPLGSLPPFVIDRESPRLAPNNDLRFSRGLMMCVWCAGVLSPYKTRMLDEDHRDWLLPAMTKALLEGGPVKLKDDSVRLTHKKRRSSPRKEKI